MNYSSREVENLNRRARYILLKCGAPKGLMDDVIQDAWAMFIKKSERYDPELGSEDTLFFNCVRWAFGDMVKKNRCKSRQGLTLSLDVKDVSLYETIAFDRRLPDRPEDNCRASTSRSFWQAVERAERVVESGFTRKSYVGYFKRR
ncbi:MAG: hypothetical protein HUK22_04195, partial [Thermoguttaceae bacterium]|nr:hypothetical protein [Thermoguttaceae bacterium]